MEGENWKEGIARDVISLGSWVFYFLVIGRALIMPYRPFVDQVVIAGIVLILVELVFRKWDRRYDWYLSRALVLVVFTIIFYESFVYGVFAVVAFLLMLIASAYLGRGWKEILVGLVVGSVGILFGYVFGDFSFNLI